ncbi:DUF4320 family protein [Exiguobacterium sp. BG5(2022)]|uniref:DUF4320 family protein n=1 Tax=Exiguobacterium sp. BG5(2022) TaxID=2962595 RepID=UPI002882B1D8|nr:DUF4320 family protein [Exiguobacterium sp. BG5(2022)]MDT0193731.1 DUF4320 family protein [Exiguobacterium sp. BG5(2022)]
MKGTVALAFGIIILIPFIMFIPDLAIYGIQSHKASVVAADITKEAEMRGGVTSDLKNYAQERLDETGLSDNGYQVSYRVEGVGSEGKTQYRGKISVRVEGEYQFKTFNFLNTGSPTLKVVQQQSGTSQLWLR